MDKATTSGVTGKEEPAAEQRQAIAPRTASAPRASGPWGIAEHDLRGAVLGELHARPFRPLTTPQRIYHFGLVTTQDEARLAREMVAKIAASRGQAPPAAEARQHQVALGPWTLNWEQHTEFTTFTWSTAQDAGRPFADTGVPDFGAGGVFQPPGQLLVALRLCLVDAGIKNEELEKYFDRSSLAVIVAAEGGARVATDFQVDAAGFVRYIVENRKLRDTRTGRLVQRVLELDSYRTLALLGGPVAREAGPVLGRFESKQAEMTRAISNSKSVDENRVLLTQLTDLAAELEAQVARTSFRFGATRAYATLVDARLKAMREGENDGYVSFSRFLRRRLSPVVETCKSIDNRQLELSQKLSRTARLLSTRIQFDLEQQNRSLLQSMNRRARLQLRLQQTVEGLSIGAISYYVVGLVGYMAKGGKAAGLLPPWLTPEIITALSVPLVILSIWGILHHARKNWSKSDEN